MQNNTVKKNKSVTRVLDIIEVMSRHGEPIKLQELAKKLEMPAPTPPPPPHTLIESHYVKQNKETLKYYLTLKICQIATFVQDSINIREIALPILKELAEKTQESASMVIEEDLMAVYIERVEGPDKMIRGFQRIGRRAPLYCTGVGKLFLSEFDEKTLKEVIDKGLEPFTQNTITDKAMLLKELKKVREQGYAIDDEECEVGARCIAAPVRDYTGKIITAVSISGPISRLSYDDIENKKHFVIEAGKAISNF